MFYAYKGKQIVLHIKGKRLYCCFIDYIKAFDSVAHVKLWLKLSRIGITGKLLNVIKSMYSKLKACISTGLPFKDHLSSGFTLPLLLKTTIFVLFRFTYKP
jgi:hypothetical protein